MSSFRDRPSMPDTDVFGVTRQTAHGLTVFLVTHYPTRAAQSPCCRAAITQQPDESEYGALSRAAAAIDAQHAAKLARSA
jgi:hypothetical protein